MQLSSLEPIETAPGLAVGGTRVFYPADSVALLANELAKEIRAATVAKIDSMIMFQCEFLRAAGREIVNQKDVKRQFIDRFIPDPEMYGALDENYRIPAHHDMSDLLKSAVKGLMTILVEPLEIYSYRFAVRLDNWQDLSVLAKASEQAEAEQIGSITEQKKETPAQSALEIADSRLRHAALDIANLVTSVMPRATVLREHRDYYRRAKTITALLVGQERTFLDSRSRLQTNSL